MIKRISVIGTGYLGATHAACLAELGFERLYLHHVGQDQQRFIDAFGAKVIPELTS